MKQLILTTSLFLASNFFAQEQLVNSSFENWYSTNGYEDLNGWFTANEAYLFGYPIIATKTTDATTGNFALKISKNASECTSCGILYDSTMTIGQVAKGNPFSSRPDSLKFDLKFLPVGTSTLKVRLKLSKWNASTNSSQIIGVINEDIANTYTNYTQLEFPVTYLNNLNPDTILVEFNVNYSDPVNNTDLYLDNLQLIYSSESVDEYISEKIDLFPNPVSSLLTVLEGQFEDFEIYSSEGKIIMTGNFNELNNTIDCSHFKNGIYILKTNRWIRRITVQH